VVGAGLRCPHGTLPVFSVADEEEEAQELIVLACPTNFRGEYIAEELTGLGNQTLENLARFGARLEKLHDEVLVPHGRCRCSSSGKPKTAGVT